MDETRVQSPARNPRPAAGTASFDAFISYSHRDAHHIGPALQAAMHKLAKPWYRLRALRLFLDRTDLGATPALWPTIERALRASRYLIVVGSPEAARSPWVPREIEAWLGAGNPPSRLLIVLAGGAIAWRPEAHDFDWRQTDALPRILGGLFDDEPLWVDVRFATGSEHMTLRHPEFAAAVARLAAPVRGLEPEVLISTDYREHRRAVQLAWSAGALLAALAVAALVLYLRAESARSDAEQARATAESRRQEAEGQKALAVERLSDARVGQARFATLSGQFDLAWDGLGDSADNDDRLKLARWVVAQHRSYPARLTPKLVERGISSLAVHAASGELVGLDDAFFAGGRPRVVVIDPTGPKVIGEVAAPSHASTIVAGDEPGAFYAIGRGMVTRVTRAASGWSARPLATAPPLRASAWFSGSSSGIGLRGAELVALSVRGDDLRQTPLARVGTNSTLLASPDGSLLGVGEARGDRDRLNDLGQRRNVRIVELRDGQPVVLPVDAADADVRLVGGRMIGSLDKRDRLHLRRIDDGHEVETRGIDSKPWLGHVLALPGSVVVQEVGDTTQEAVAKMSVLDLATGRDLLGPFLSKEPIWASAVDRARSHLYLAGQDGWLVDVDMSEERVLARALPTMVEEPIVVRAPDEIVVRKTLDLDRTTVHLNLRTLEARTEPARFPNVRHELPDGGFITWHDCPFEGAISPDFARLAVNGSRLWIADLTERERSEARANRLDVPAVCQRVAQAPAVGTWSPPGLDPPHAMRWAGDAILVIHDFHGGARRIDVAAKKHEAILEPETVVTLSQTGPVRFSMLSGTVFQVASDGTPSVYAKLPNLRALFPLLAADATDQGSSSALFVGAMDNPPRTAFLAMHKGALEEVASVPDTGMPLDARVVGDRVIVLYRKSVRVYPRLLPGR